MKEYFKTGKFIAICFGSLFSIFGIAFLVYGILNQVITRWDLPSKEVQFALLEKEMKQVNVEKYFVPVNEKPFHFVMIKVGRCDRDFYILDTIEKTVDKYVEIHKQNGWMLENKRKHDGREVTLVKGNLRTFVYTGYDTHTKTFAASYKYRDGFFEK